METCSSFLEGNFAESIVSYKLWKLDNVTAEIGGLTLQVDFDYQQ
mgnify:CR=1 FL=1